MVVPPPKPETEFQRCLRIADHYYDAWMRALRNGQPRRAQYEQQYEAWFALAQQLANQAQQG